MDKELLKLNVYNFNMENMKNGIEKKLKDKYSSLLIESIIYNKDDNFFYISLDYNIKPIITFNNRKFRVRLNKKVKFKLMEVV